MLLSPVTRSQERLQLDRYVDVDGDDYKDYVFDRLQQLCADASLWKYRE